MRFATLGIRAVAGGTAPAPAVSLAVFVAALFAPWLAASSAHAAPLTGVVYDAVSGQPVAGVALHLEYDADDPIAPGQRVPDAALAAGQQDQVTRADGNYRFDVAGGRRYRVVIDTAQIAYSAPSVRIPPRAGFAPLGEVVASPLPAPPGTRAADRRWFTRWDIPADGDRVVNNHLAVDPLPGVVTVRKRADRLEAAIGDVVRYTVEVENRSPRDLIADAGRPLFVHDTPARGLVYPPGRAIARVRRSGQTVDLVAGQGFADERTEAGLRFGPFELPAGAALVLEYQLVVGQSTRIGHADNRAIVRDGDGRAITDEATARVAITADPALATGTILGRVSCHGGGRGVMGARVYADTGSYAVTDADGRYHVSRVGAGTRLVKLHDATLAGGAVIGPAARIVQLSGGAPARIDFAVRCADTRVALAAAPGAGSVSGARTDSAAVSAVSIGGDAAALALRVAGRSVSLPAAAIDLDVPAALSAGAPDRLVPVPAGGWGPERPAWRASFTPPDGADVGVARWTLDIVRLPDSGGEPARVRALSGAALPAVIAWDGLTDAGPAPPGVYAARLTVFGDARRAEAAGAWRVFAIGRAGGEPVTHVIRGEMFASGLRPTAALRREVERIAHIVGSLPPGAGVQVFAHVAGGGDRLAEIAQTQREAQAVADLLVARGVAEGAVSARGRGSLEPLRRDDSPAARRDNRRIAVVIATPASAPVEFPASVTASLTGDDSPAVLVDGQPIALDGTRFATRVEVRPSSAGAGAILVDVRAPDGRRGALAVPVDGRGAPIEATDSPPAAGDGGDGETRTIQVRGDLGADPSASRIEYGEPGATFSVVPRGLLAIDARLAGSGEDTPAVATRARGGRRSLVAPLVFELSASGVPADASPDPDAPAALSGIRTWRLIVTGADGAPIRALGGAGPPPASVRWDGADASGALVLAPRARYRYRLVIAGAAGARAESPPRSFAVDPAPTGPLARLAMRGRLFTPAGLLAARFKNHLSRVVWILRRDPPERRYVIDLVLSAPAGASTEQAEKARARRTAIFRRYVRRLGLADARIALRVRAGATDGFAIAPVTEQPEDDATPDAPRVLIDGVPLAVAAAAWTADVKVPAGGAALLDVTWPSGRRVVVPILAPAAAESSGAAPADPAARPGEPTAAPAAAPPAAASVRAADTEVWLPARGVVVRARELAITGRTRPGNRITVAVRPAATATAGQATDQPAAAAGSTPGEPGEPPAEVTVGADGRFATTVRVPDGHAVVDIRALDPDGGRAELAWPIEVDDRAVLVLALAEATAATARAGGAWSSDTLFLDSVDHTSSTAVGPFRLAGRAAVYVTGRIDGGPIADRLDVTAYVDTSRTTAAGAFYDDPDDATRSFPSYGDAADEVRHIDTRRKYFAEIATGSARAVIGSVETDIGAGLLRYDRVVTGGKLDVDRRGDGWRSEFRVFGARTLDGLARDVAHYRATGGTLYYLRHGHVAEGSERVRVVVRDRDSGLVASERELSRNRDYRIDYQSGRIMLVEPISSAVGAGGLAGALSGAASALGASAGDAGIAPSLGDPVFLEVRYEHADPRADGSADDGVFGAYGRASHGRVSFGAGLVREQRAGAGGLGDATLAYELWGADATVQAGPRSPIRLELAASRRGNGADAISYDGGMSFADLDHVADADAAGGGAQLAWRVSGDLQLGDFGEAAWLERTRLGFYAQGIDRGFSSDRATLDAGRVKLGALASHRLNPCTALSLRHHSEWSWLPRVGPTLADIAASADPLSGERTATHRAALQWTHRRGRWEHRLEGVYWQRTGPAALADGVIAGSDPGLAMLTARRVGAGAGTSYAVTDRVTVRASQHGVVAVGDGDPRLSPIVLAADPGVSDDPAADPGVRSDRPLAGVITGAGVDVRLSDDVGVGVDALARWTGDIAVQAGLRSALSPTGSMYVRERLEQRDGRAVTTAIVGAEDRIADTGGRSYGEYQLEHGVHGERARAVLGLGHRWQLWRGVRAGAGYEHQQVVGGHLPDGTPIGDNRRDVMYAAAEWTRSARLRAVAHVELRLDDGLGGLGAATGVVRDDARPTANPGEHADHGGVVPGAPLALREGDATQVVGRVAAAWKWTAAVTALARASVSRTDVTGGGDAGPVDDPGAVAGVGALDARYSEITGGLAYRPLSRPWSLLARASVVRDLRPDRADPRDAGNADGFAALGARLGADQRSHVVVVEPLVALPWRLEVAGKLAWKRTRAVDVARDGEDGAGGGGGALVADALLWLVRVGYRMHRRLDVSGEVRGLTLDVAGVREGRRGVLFELGVRTTDNIRIGFGYNASRFSDDELGDLTRDAHGLFVRLTGYY